MRFLRIIGAYVAAAAATYVAAAGFMTQQVLASRADIGLVYSITDALETYFTNLLGQRQLALAFSLGLAIAFAVAAQLKRILKPLAPIAYPLAGAAAVLTAELTIDAVMAQGNAAALDGTYGPVGMALQALAGALGGLVFALLLPRR